MQMAKTVLAVARAGVLALSVLTGCANGVKSKDVADSLTKMGIKVEQSKDVDKTAKETLTAIEAIIDAKTNADKPDTDDSKIKLSNAVVKADGKVIKENNFVGSVDNVKKALGVFATGSDAEKANVGKQIRVALVEIKNAKKDASLQAALAKDALVEAQAATVANTTTHKVAETGKLGTATTKDGKYILVVIVNDVVAKNA